MNNYQHMKHYFRNDKATYTKQFVYQQDLIDYLAELDAQREDAGEVFYAAPQRGFWANLSLRFGFSW